MRFFVLFLLIYLLFSDGAYISIARSDQDTRPVRALERYIAAAGINMEEDLPRCRALALTNAYCKVHPQGNNYTWAREIVKYAFKGITDMSAISLRSLKARVCVCVGGGGGYSCC